ncbi:MAG: cobyric acid synthase [bacterium]
MAKTLMIQGTGSGVGKSLIVTALCRIFKDMGVDVVPFKAQNMALNSYITIDGGEIGRAQALQAQAARLEPEVDMNPILLKPSGEAGVQVIIHGKAYATMKAKGYYGFKRYVVDAVISSFDRLSKTHELIILEGAGSPAEINLRKDDMVNMAMARYANAPVLLVGDIDKGGVFASFYGTIELLKDSTNLRSKPRLYSMPPLLKTNPPYPPLLKGAGYPSKGWVGGLLHEVQEELRDADYIKAFIINKFRGDLDLLKPGLKMIKIKTGKPVIGVIPYVRDIGLPEEDGVYLEGYPGRGNPRGYPEGYRSVVKIVVAKLQYISNFTDFDPFYYEPDVELIYSNNPSDIAHADMVIIPGTKNTMDDLAFLKRTGLTVTIKQAYEKGIQVIGVCGGYQILGKTLYNPYGIEGKIKKLNGIGILNIKTIFQKEKITAQVQARIVNGLAFDIKDLEDIGLKGYEIHHGVSTGDIGLFRLRRASEQNLGVLLNKAKRNEASHRSNSIDASAAPQHDNCSITSRKDEFLDYILDGSINRNCWGTYMHGIFDNDEFRRAILNNIRIKKGLKPLWHTYNYSKAQDKAIDHFAEIVRQNINMKFIKRIIGL